MWPFSWVLLVHRCVNSFSGTSDTYTCQYALFQYKEVEKVNGKKSNIVRFSYKTEDGACVHSDTGVEKGPSPARCCCPSAPGC